MTRQKCLILGASGLVGQRLQQRLHNHPLFEMTAVAGSSATVGRKLSALEWRLEGGRPELSDLTVLDTNAPNLIEKIQRLGIKIAFSALPSDIAYEVEKRLVEAGIMVFSNASSYRRTVGVPMIIPEVNPQHFSTSMHYCATNCTLIPLALPVSAINEIAEIKSVKMRSEQALSGAGWKLLFDEAALAGNVNPEIDGEAEKTGAELLYVLGDEKSGSIASADFEIDIKCKRVSRRDGHQVFVEIELDRKLAIKQVHQCLESITTNKSLPSSPITAIHIVEHIDVKQHLWSDGITFESNPDLLTDLKTGMAVIVGDIVIDENTVSFSAYSHNTIRGAAGGVVYLAEFVMNKLS
jgi:aspartate-semialdehyde dehydrogenase